MFSHFLLYEPDPQIIQEHSIYDDQQEQTLKDLVDVLLGVLEIKAVESSQYESDTKELLASWLRLVESKLAEESSKDVSPNIAVPGGMKADASPKLTSDSLIRLRDCVQSRLVL